MPGTDRPDALVGQPEPDVIAGSDGDDHITGGLEGDAACDWDGNDTIVSPGGLHAYGGAGDHYVEMTETENVPVLR